MTRTPVDRLYADLISAQGADEALPIARRLVAAYEAEIGGSPDAAAYADRILDVAALLAEPETPIPWRCKEIAADGYLTVLAGRGGEGKSWMALTLACGVARGEAAAGISCRRGRALIFDAENGRRLIGRRFKAAAVDADLDVQPVDAGGMSIASGLGWFKDTIEAQKANLVIFDSLRVLSSGIKESDSDAMEPIITALKQLARDTGAAVVLIHHRGKSELSEFRGSSVILDQTDLLFTLGRVQGDPEGRNRRKITTIKCRIDEEPVPRWVAIESDRKRRLVSVEEAEPYEGEEVGRPRRDLLRKDVLALLTDEGKPQARIAGALDRSKTDGTIRRVLKDLEAEGLAEKDESGWRLPTATRQNGGNPGNPSENGSDKRNERLPARLATGEHPDGLPANHSLGVGNSGTPKDQAR